jgi:hypothetical protein
MSDIDIRFSNNCISEEKLLNLLSLNFLIVKIGKIHLPYQVSERIRIDSMYKLYNKNPER